MKTKFDSIVKIKKNELKKIEKDLIKVNNAIKLISNKIRELQIKFNAFSIPDKGSFKEIYQIKSMQSAIRDEIENYKSQLNMLNERKDLLSAKYKDANIDYEKMKYLQTEEIKKQLKKQKQKENIQMDEIAIMLNKKKDLYE